jgi:hypothetical protein
MTVPERQVLRYERRVEMPRAFIVLGRALVCWWRAAGMLPPQDTPTPTVDALFAGKDPQVRRTYDRILEVLRAVGDVRADAKKASVHLVRSTGFAGVHPRTSALVLNSRLDRPLEDRRLLKAERVSANRYHNELKLEAPEDVDAEVEAWLRAAHDLARRAPTRRVRDDRPARDRRPSIRSRDLSIGGRAWPTRHPAAGGRPRAGSKPARVVVLRAARSAASGGRAERVGVEPGGGGSMLRQRLH